MGLRKRVFKTDEIAIFCEQIAMLLHGGIPLYEGILMMQEEIEEEQIRKILEKTGNLLRENIPFYRALQQAEAFPAYMIHMALVGEQTGKLEEVMEKLSSYYMREYNMKQEIKHIISYPLLLFSIIAIVLFTLVVKILPMFENVFHELNESAAISSEQMMKFGLVFSKGVIVLVSLTIVIILALIVSYQTKEGKRILHKAARYLSFLNYFIDELAIGKFLSSMYLMISSGMIPSEALDITSQVVEEETIRKKIIACKEDFEQGKDFQDALKDSNLITGMQGNMLLVGIRTGVFDSVLEKLSKMYDIKIEDKINRISNIIENSLVILLSFIIGSIFISLMLPVVSVISSIG